MHNNEKLKHSHPTASEDTTVLLYSSALELPNENELTPLIPPAAGQGDAKTATRSAEQVQYHQDIYQSTTNVYLSQRGIAAEDHGNLPGLIVHWHGDIERRKKAIKKWQNRSLMQKLTSFTKMNEKDPEELEITGEEISQLITSKKALGFVKELKLNPMNTTARISLVYEVVKVPTPMTMEAWRSLLLQTFLALSFGEFTQSSIRVMAWVYSAYLSSFALVCRKRLHELDAILAHSGEMNKHNEERAKLKSQQQAVQTNLKLVNHYKETLENALHGGNSLPATFKLSELEEFIQAHHDQQNLASPSSKVEKQRKELLFKAFHIVNVLRTIPQFNPISFQIAKLAINLAPQQALAFQLEGRIHLSRMQMAIKHYEAGNHQALIRHEFKDAFKHAHQCYTLGLKWVSSVPHKADVALLYEFANLCYAFYQSCLSIFNYCPPKEWFIGLLEQARHALSAALTVTELREHEKEECLNLQSKLLQEISQLNEAIAEETANATKSGQTPNET